MSNTSVILKTQKGNSTISRAKFGPGMLLQDDDLEQLNTYTRDLSRLLFRSFFGCGVVCGLQVSATDNCGQTSITVTSGVALDCIGDPIYVPKDQAFTVTDGCDETLGPLWVVLCSRTKCCAPRTPACGCDSHEEPAACTREVDCFEIRVVRERPDCACGCLEPEKKQTSVNPTAGVTRAVAQQATASTTAPTDACQCTDPTSACYADHYNGICGCKCDDCNCVLLARLDRSTGTPSGWTPDYRVRRFIRPVLIRDPLAYPPQGETPTAQAKAAKKKSS